MLILDKQKAVERVMALTSGEMEPAPGDGPREASAARVRTYQRIATFERRARATPAPLRRSIERRRRRMRLIGGPAPAG
jgi:hypothetical protein